MESLKQLDNAIDYIEKNLDEQISYEEAARIACCSASCFQRIFSYIAGIPLSEYIRRRRMTQAAFELQATDCKILNIALKYGYTSPTSFNRTFRKVHGITPVLARAKGSVLQAYPPIRLSVKISGENAFSYRIEKKATMRMVGIRISLTSDMESNRKIVPAFWEKIIKDNRLEEISKLSDQIPETISGITFCNAPQDIRYYIAMETDKPIPKGLSEVTIPTATWVVIEDNGNFKDAVQGIFRRFPAEWLPCSGYEYAGLPDIEVYPIKKEMIRTGHIEVWIAIKKKSKD
ncbi:MAG: AraC family transcriptional regulator [Spirochaetia bacterium]|nr:AraC family transcriptional regulator [Spirochaetia bacterium]